jgi:hypothetical protein
MPRFLIEVPHAEEVSACVRCVQAFLATGSHALTHADWGCMDGDHRSWLIVEVDSKEEARTILPPVCRADAKIIALNKFTMEEIDEILGHHKP